MSGTFTCERCQKTFPKGWSDEEAEAEYTRLWGEHMGEDRIILCDPCDVLFKEWLKNHPMKGQA